MRTLVCTVFTATLVAYISGKPTISHHDGKLPEENMNVTERIRYHGYPSAREYLVTTEDCYLLYIQRIQQPRGKPFVPGARKPVVFLQHGLTAASGCWITNLPGESLAYLLADAGYDVWLGNVRGNSYGLGHCKPMTHNDCDFWKFTWQHMAEYDLPAMVNYILADTTQDKLIYIGHSQGTLMAFAHFSEQPEWAMKRIEKFVAIAPVATVHDISTDLRKLARYTKEIEAALNTLCLDSLGQLDWVLKYVKPICNMPSKKVLDACENLLFFFLGSQQKAFVNESRVPLIIHDYPEGTSTMNIAHFGQMVNSGKMQKYDYGTIGNYEHYRLRNPPMYNLKNFPRALPTRLYWSDKDELADPQDIKNTILPNITQATQLHLTDFSHCDFIWALSATKDVYADILNYIKS